MAVPNIQHENPLVFCWTVAGGSLLLMKKFFASFLLTLLCVHLLSVLFLYFCRYKVFYFFWVAFWKTLLKLQTVYLLQVWLCLETKSRLETTSLKGKVGWRQGEIEHYKNQKTRKQNKHFSLIPVDQDWRECYCWVLLVELERKLCGGQIQQTLSDRGTYL